MHDTNTQVACKGFCPCPSPAKLKQEKQAMRLSQFESKYKSTVGTAKESFKPKVIFAPEVAKFKKELFGKKNEHAPAVDLSTDKQRQRGYNDVIPEKKETLLRTGKFHSYLFLSFTSYVMTFF